MPSDEFVWREIVRGHRSFAWETSTKLRKEEGAQGWGAGRVIHRGGDGGEGWMRVIAGGRKKTMAQGSCPRHGERETCSSVASSAADPPLATDDQFGGEGGSCRGEYAEVFARRHLCAIEAGFVGAAFVRTLHKARHITSAHVVQPYLGIA